MLNVKKQLWDDVFYSWFLVHNVWYATSRVIHTKLWLKLQMSHTSNTKHASQEVKRCANHLAFNFRDRVLSAEANSKVPCSMLEKPDTQWFQARRSTMLL